MGVNIYDRDVHNFVTTGARAVAYPLAANVDTGTALATNPAIDAAGNYWVGSTAAIKAAYYPRLLKIQCMSVNPTAGSVISILDNAGNVVYAFVFSADPCDKCREFWWGGLALPKGGFGVTSTNGESWMYVFTYDAAIP